MKEPKKTAETGNGSPPTASELSVLRLLSTDLTQRQIAHELFLSHNTVKSHSRSLYRKLGANTRDEAIRRALEVGLLTPPRAPRQVERPRTGRMKLHSPLSDPV